MNLDNFYFFTGNSYAGKSTMMHLLAQKYDGIECGENYHDNYDELLAPPQMAVGRFFDRPDKEKQFLYQLMMEEPDPQAALDNYRKGLELICSQEDYDKYLHCGFEVNIRENKLGLEGTMALIEKKLSLEK